MNIMKMMTYNGSEAKRVRRSTTMTRPHQAWKKHQWADGYRKQKMMTEANPMGCHLATILSTSLQANAFNIISKITHVFLDSFCIHARTGALRKARLWVTNSGIEGDYQMSIDNVLRCQTEKKINGNGNGMKQHPRMGERKLFCHLRLERKTKGNCLWQLTIFGDIICPTS